MACYRRTQLVRKKQYTDTFLFQGVPLSGFIIKLDMLHEFLNTLHSMFECLQTVHQAVGISVSVASLGPMRAMWARASTQQSLTGFLKRGVFAQPKKKRLCYVSPFSCIGSPLLSVKFTSLTFRTLLHPNPALCFSQTASLI